MSQFSINKWMKYAGGNNWSTDLLAAFSFESSSPRCQRTKYFRSGNLLLHRVNRAKRRSPFSLSKELRILSIRRAAKWGQNTRICQSNLSIKTYLLIRSPHFKRHQTRAEVLNIGPLTDARAAKHYTSVLKTFQSLLRAFHLVFLNDGGSTL